MNAMQIFDYSGHAVRVVEVAGVPYFVGSDVAEVLGYDNSQDTLRKYEEGGDAL
ncbi:MAG: hypothetical protein K5746_09445 [Clostridiales bacterium]|nr:hypothetical protein [Clostridiales bacterium]